MTEYLERWKEEARRLLAAKAVFGEGRMPKGYSITDVIPISGHYYSGYRQRNYHQKHIFVMEGPHGTFLASDNHSSIKPLSLKEIYLEVERFQKITKFLLEVYSKEALRIATETTETA